MQMAAAQVLQEGGGVSTHSTDAVQDRYSSLYRAIIIKRS